MARGGGSSLAGLGEELCGEVVQVLVNLLQRSHFLLQLRHTHLGVLAITKHTLVCYGTHDGVEFVCFLQRSPFGPGCGGPGAGTLLRSPRPRPVLRG